MDQYGLQMVIICCFALNMFFLASATFQLYLAKEFYIEGGFGGLEKSLNVFQVIRADRNVKLQTRITGRFQSHQVVCMGMLALAHEEGFMFVGTSGSCVAIRRRILGSKCP